MHSFLHTTMILRNARTENKQLQEKFNALENQSMRDNLIFTEQSGEKDNDCSRKCYDLLRYLYKTITSWYCRGGVSSENNLKFYFLDKIITIWESIGTIWGSEGGSSGKALDILLYRPWSCRFWYSPCSDRFILKKALVNVLLFKFQCVFS